jgi:hypothetical protein
VKEPSLFLDMLLDEGEYFVASQVVAKLFENVELRHLRALTASEKEDQSRLQQQQVCSRSSNNNSRSRPGAVGQVTRVMRVGRACCLDFLATDLRCFCSRFG